MKPVGINVPPKANSSAQNSVNQGSHVPKVASPTIRQHNPVITNDADIKISGVLNYKVVQALAPTEPELILRIVSLESAMADSEKKAGPGINEKFENLLDNGHLNTCRRMIKKHIHLLKHDTKNGKNFLCEVVKAGDTKSFDFFRSLVRDPEDRQKILERKDGDGYTPLMLATKYHIGDNLIKRMLRVARPESLINSIMPNGETLLINALRHYADNKIFFELIENIKDRATLTSIMHKLEKDDASIFSVAVENKYIAVVKQAIELLPNQRAVYDILARPYQNGETVVMMAAQQKSKHGVLKFLLNAIHDPERRLDLLQQTSLDGMTPLIFSLKSKDADAFQMLCSEINDFQIIQKQLETKTKYSETSLMCAVNSNNPEMVSMVLGFVSNPEEILYIKTSDGNSVLDIIINNDDPYHEDSYVREKTIIDMLKEKIIDKNKWHDHVTQKEKNGMTRLMRAVRNDDEEGVELLLNTMFDVQSKTEFIEMKMIDGTTAMMIALKNGNKKIISMLLDAITDPIRKQSLINAEKIDGTTAFMIAVQFCGVEVVRKLLDMASSKSSLIMQEDLDGYDSIDYAKLRNNKEMIDLLKNI